MLARFLLTACLVMTGLLSATTASARELRMAFDEVPATLDIHEQLSESVLQLAHISFDPLIRWTRELSFEPRLATSFQRLDENTVRFKLRKGVQFHRGYGEFTAKDVVFSHSLMVRDDSIATLGDLWRQVDSVETPDDYTVVFHFTNPVTKVTAEYAFARSGDLKIVSKAQFDKEGDATWDHPAGTGSYEFVERSPGLNIVYKAVENHWSGVTPASPYVSMFRDIPVFSFMALGAIVGWLLYLAWVSFLSVAWSNATNLTERVVQLSEITRDFPRAIETLPVDHVSGLCYEVAC